MHQGILSHLIFGFLFLELVISTLFPISKPRAPSAAEITHQFPNPVKGRVNDLFANGVVSPGIVVSGIFFASDQLLRVE